MGGCLWFHQVDVFLCSEFDKLVDYARRLPVRQTELRHRLVIVVVGFDHRFLIAQTNCHRRMAYLLAEYVQGCVGF